MSENEAPVSRPGIASVACKIAKVMGLLNDIPKSGYHAKHGYHYSTNDDVYGAIRKAMSAANLALHVTMKDTSQQDFTASNSKGTRTTVYLVLTLICGDTGEHLIADWTGTADTFGESSEKGVDKAAGLGVKSWLRKTFLVSAEETDDAQQRTRPTQERAPRQSRQQPASNGNKGDGFKAPPWWNAVMSAVIRPIYNGNQQHATNSIKKLIADGKLAADMSPELVIGLIQSRHAQPDGMPE